MDRWTRFYRFIGRTKVKVKHILFYSIYSSLMQYTPTTASPPFPPPPNPPVSPLPEIHCSFMSLQKRAGLPVISTELGITRCNKARNIPLYQGCTRKPSRRKWVPQAGKRIRDTPSNSHCSKSNKNPKLKTHSMYTEDLVQTQAGSGVADSVSTRPYKPGLLGHVLLVSSNPLAPTIPHTLFFGVP